ncbi:MAG: hypothetical protein AAF799_46610 [Myxococcota bacterium]
MADVDWEHEVNTWILRADYDAIETRGDVVSTIPALVDVVIVDYRSATHDEQRTAAVLLLPERFDEDFHPVLRDYASRIVPEAHTPSHRALVKALCILQGDWSSRAQLFDDLEGSIAKGREYAPAPSAKTTAMVPAVGFGDIEFGMGSDALIAMLGTPDVNEPYGKERDLEFEAKGIEASFKHDKLRTLFVELDKQQGPITVQHPTKRDLTVQVPISQEDLEARWGEPRSRARTTTMAGQRRVVFGYVGVAFHFSAKTGDLISIAMSV